MTTSWDPSKIRSRAGQAFFMPYPTDPPTATDPAGIVEEYFGHFYVDPLVRVALKPGVQPWAYINAEGLIMDPKFKALDFAQAVGLRINVGKYLDTYDGEMNIGDVPVEKFAEILSATSREVIESSTTTQAGVGILKKGVLLGTQPFNAHYMMVYRFPSVDESGFLIPGAWDHLLVPRVTFRSDPKLAFTQTKAQEYKVVVCAESDLYLVSPDSGLYAAAYFEECVRDPNPVVSFLDQGFTIASPIGRFLDQVTL